MLAAAVMRDAGGDHRFLHVDARGHPQAVGIEAAAFALLGGEHLIGDRVLNQPGDDLAFVLEGEGYGEMRDAVQEVGGAVDRIDDPAIAVVLALDLTGFLHQEADLRPRLRQLDHQDFLGAQIRRRHEIRRALAADLKLLDFAEVAAQRTGGLLGRRRHDVHEGRT